MGAFLGRSLLFFAGILVAVDDVAVDFSSPAAVDLLFCASSSLTLTSAGLSFRCHGVAGGQAVWEEMLVSGVPLFLGGKMGASDSSV